MRLHVAALVCLAFAGIAHATPIEFTTTVRARGQMVVRGGGQFSFGSRVEEPVTIVGRLDPETDLITYDEVSWTVPGREHTRTFEVTTTITTPEMCDFYGCTPRTTTETSTPFTLTLSYDPYVVTVHSFSVPIVEYEANSARLGGYPGGIVDVPATTGAWRIDGPTESESGTYSIAGSEWTGLFSRSVTLQRDPPGSGPVVAWSGNLRDEVTTLPRRRRYLARDVEVDGATISIRTAPEPAALGMVALACAVAMSCRGRSSRT